MKLPTRKKIKPFCAAPLWVVKQTTEAASINLAYHYAIKKHPKPSKAASNQAKISLNRWRSWAVWILDQSGPIFDAKRVIKSSVNLARRIP